RSSGKAVSEHLRRQIGIGGAGGEGERFSRDEARVGNRRKYRVAVGPNRVRRERRWSGEEVIRCRAIREPPFADVVELWFGAEIRRVDGRAIAGKQADGITVLREAEADMQRGISIRVQVRPFVRPDE